ncbi:MAG: hypothetical protein ACYS6W_07670 [Planctomycetota bacterium]|jgi:hypothetical protein
MNKEGMLRNAKNHCFFIGLNDSGSELCKANTVYGIAGIHYVQNQLDIRPNATFISTPDMTITRNTGRWRSGFGYGGKISWGAGDDDLIILDTKPNACGMLVGGLEQPPDIVSLIKKLHELEASKMEMDGIEVIWEFYKSNHFIDMFRVKSVAKLAQSLPPYAFIIHGSADEFRGDNESGFGIYYDKSKQLREIAENVETPFGEFRILTGSDAKKYFERYQCAENFSKKKRKVAAELLFGKFVEISNETHQGLVNMNEIVLGCHYLNDNATLFPLTLRADLPAYLVKGNPNLSSESIELLGFEKRAKRLGVYDRLLNADIFPHGGGYVLPDILTVNKVIEVDGERYFEAEMQNDRGKKIISEVRELPYEYRGRKVVLRALEIGLIEIVAKLIPQHVLKI